MSVSICGRCRKKHQERSQYCAECKPIRKQQAPKHTTKKRDPFYGSGRWQKLSRYYGNHHPLCEICLTKGRTTPKQLVDHIIEIKDGGASLDSTNLQSLCHKCHGKKTAQSARERAR